MFRDSRSLSLPKEEKAISIYSNTSVSRTRRDCQNVFELLVVQATEVAYFQREHNKFRFRSWTVSLCYDKLLPTTVALRSNKKD